MPLLNIYYVSDTTLEIKGTDWAMQTRALIPAGSGASLSPLLCLRPHSLQL